MQYRVSTASRVCLAKKVRVNARSSWIGLFSAPAYQEVNSKEFEVCFFFPDRPASTYSTCCIRVVFE